MFNKIKKFFSKEQGIPEIDADYFFNLTQEKLAITNNVESECAESVYRSYYNDYILKEIKDSVELGKFDCGISYRFLFENKKYNLLDDLSVEDRKIVARIIIHLEKKKFIIKVYDNHFNINWS